MSQTTTFLVRPADDPHPQAHTDNGEDIFVALLDELGFVYLIEPDTLEIEPRHIGHTAKGITPDIKLVALPDGRQVDGFYIELTIADRFLYAGQLPKRVRDKNRKSGLSRKEFIKHTKYFLLKRAKIAAALANHDADILLLTGADQDAILAEPQLLSTLLAPYLHRALARAKSQAAA